MSEIRITAFELSVVLRHITYARWRTVLSIGAIGLAVAISIVFVSIQNGFQEFLFDIVFKNLPHVTVSPLEGKDYLHLYRSIIDSAWSIPGVIGVSPNLASTATIAYKDRAENVAMMGIEPGGGGQDQPDQPEHGTGRPLLHSEWQKNSNGEGIG